MSYKLYHGFLKVKEEGVSVVLVRGQVIGEKCSTVIKTQFLQETVLWLFNVAKLHLMYDSPSQCHYSQCAN